MFSVDVTPAVVTSLSITSVTTNSALITWTTDTPTSQGSINYFDMRFSGRNLFGYNVYESPEIANTPRIEHSLTLPNLESGMTYAFTVRGNDHMGYGVNNVSVSGYTSIIFDGHNLSYTFTTLSGL
ncbi:hypothetical protein EXS56_02645 [Candidatus Kaiserbacteria bacterium]|nr:hypothetical protein [Candidatus Kaiserbacteria bacterium]